MLYTIEQVIETPSGNHSKILHMGRDTSIAEFCLQREHKHYHVLTVAVIPNYETKYTLTVKPEYVTYGKGK